MKHYQSSIRFCILYDGFIFVGGKGNDANHVRGQPYDNPIAPKKTGSGGHLTKGGGFVSVVADSGTSSVTIDGIILAK